MNKACGEGRGINILMALLSDEQLRLTVTDDEYLDKLVEYCIMKLYAIASVEETRQTWADEDDFQVLKPNIDVKVNLLQLVGLALAKLSVYYKILMDRKNSRNSHEYY